MNRLEEIEAALASPPEPTHYPVDIDHLSAADIAWLSQREVTKADVAWLCAEVRRLHGQLEMAEASPKTCEGCYWWIPSSESVWGDCQRVRKDTTQQYRGLAIAEGVQEYDGAWLMTSSTFGCNLWKEAGDDTE